MGLIHENHPPANNEVLMSTTSEPIKPSGMGVRTSSSSAPSGPLKTPLLTEVLRNETVQQLPTESSNNVSTYDSEMRKMAATLSSMSGGSGQSSSEADDESDNASVFSENNTKITRTPSGNLVEEKELLGAHVLSMLLEERRHSNSESPTNDEPVTQRQLPQTPSKKAQIDERKRRRPQMCRRCGLPRKGHMCAAVTMLPITSANASPAKRSQHVQGINGGARKRLRTTPETINENDFVLNNPMETFFQALSSQYNVPKAAAQKLFKQSLGLRNRDSSDSSDARDYIVDDPSAAFVNYLQQNKLLQVSRDDSDQSELKISAVTTNGPVVQIKLGEA